MNDQEKKEITLCVDAATRDKLRKEYPRLFPEEWGPLEWHGEADREGRYGIEMQEPIRVQDEGAVMVKAINVHCTPKMLREAANIFLGIAAYLEDIAENGEQE